MTELEALVSLNMVPAMGGLRLKRLLDVFGSPQDILNAPFVRLRAVEGIGETIASDIISLKKEDLEKEFTLIKKHNLKIISWEDPNYPENLKNIPDPAPLLYIKGELQKEDRMAIAIVGSRRASFYGLSCAEKFAYELASLGLTVVSGLAYGIDTQAHKGALKAGGRTISVLGSGLANIYPSQNKKLAEQISESGAVISEFPIDMPPKKENFPRRNRVISGLSVGVLIVEAARNSGALITADFALEQGREVFALPGKVDSSTSFGTNELIKQGAKLVSCTDDILEELNLYINRNPKNIETRILKEESKTQILSDREELLYNMISNEPITLDEIIENSNLDIAKISDVLLKLQLKKLIRALVGKQFVRA